jgi:hypothetical protein
VNPLRVAYKKKSKKKEYSAAVTELAAFLRHKWENKSKPKKSTNEKFINDHS